MQILERFTKECWLPFIGLYRASKPYLLKEGGGTPSRLIWSEHDIVLQTAIRAAIVFGSEWVHVESPAPKRKLDLVITNPAPFFDKARVESPEHYDFAAEFKIVLGDEHPSYNVAAVEEDLAKLSAFKREGTIVAGVVCVLDKSKGGHEGAYRELEKRHGIPVRQWCDATVEP